MVDYIFQNSFHFHVHRHNEVRNFHNYIIEKPTFPAQILTELTIPSRNNSFPVYIPFVHNPVLENQRRSRSLSRVTYHSIDRSALQQSASQESSFWSCLFLSLRYLSKYRFALSSRERRPLTYRLKIKKKQQANLFVFLSFSRLSREITSQKQIHSKPVKYFHQRRNQI